MEGDATEFDVLSRTYGEVIAGKRNLVKALRHIGILKIGSVTGYPVPSLSLLYSKVPHSS